MKNLALILGLFTIVAFGSCKKDDDTKPMTKSAAVVTPTPTPTGTGDSVYFTLELQVPIGLSGDMNTSIHYWYDTSNVRILLNNTPINLNARTNRGNGRIDVFSNVDEYTHPFVYVTMNVGDSLVFEVDSLLYPNAFVSGYIHIGTTPSKGFISPFVGWGDLGNCTMKNTSLVMGDWLGDANTSWNNGIASWYKGHPYRYVYIHH